MVDNMKQSLQEAEAKLVDEQKAKNTLMLVRPARAPPVAAVLVISPTRRRFKPGNHR